MMITVMMLMMMITSVYDIMIVVVLIFHIRFKGSFRPDWRCRGCVVMIIIMTAGHAEDAR